MDLIWFGENTVSNSSKIVRLNALHSFPTSIDWNRRKARKRSNLLEHAQLDRLKRWKARKGSNLLEHAQLGRLKRWKARKRSNLLEQTDCNSVHQDSIEWNSWCEDPTSIDWNRRKARKRSNLLEHAQLGRLKRWKLKLGRLKSLEVQMEKLFIKF